MQERQPMPGRHRSHSGVFKRQVVAEHHAGKTLHTLSRRRDLSWNPIRIRDGKAETGALDENGAAASRSAHEARIAGIETWAFAVPCSPIGTPLPAPSRHAQRCSCRTEASSISLEAKSKPARSWQAGNRAVFM